jgi:hypothetical protein
VDFGRRKKHEGLDLENALVFFRLFVKAGQMFADGFGGVGGGRFRDPSLGEGIA